jgi:hypothetical protein
MVLAKDTIMAFTDNGVVELKNLLEMHRQDANLFTKHPLLRPTPNGCLACVAPQLIPIYDQMVVAVRHAASSLSVDSQARRRAIYCSATLSTLYAVLHSADSPRSRGT